MNEYPWTQADNTPELDAQAQADGEKRAEDEIKVQIKALRQTVDEMEKTLTILYNARCACDLLRIVAESATTPNLKGGTLLKAKAITGLDDAEGALHDLYNRVLSEHEYAQSRLLELEGDDEPPF